MRAEDERNGDDALAQAQATVARQQEEIERLTRRLEGERFAERLERALTLASTAGELGSPMTHERLLELIVDTAAHVIAARSAALFLLDEETQELVFQVALGSKADEVRKFRVPLGHGVAGLVAVSGQPMAVANARQDPRVAVDIAESVGYVPESVLCVPLFDGSRVIGALELLDKEGGDSFTAADIEALGLFANQAAVALQQSRTHSNLASLVVSVLDSLAERDREQLAEGAREFAARVAADPEYRRILELAVLVHEVARYGEREAEACRAVLAAFADYLRQRPGFGDGSPFAPR